MCYGNHDAVIDAMHVTIIVNRSIYVMTLELKLVDRFVGISM